MKNKKFKSWTGRSIPRRNLPVIDWKGTSEYYEEKYRLSEKDAKLLEGMFIVSYILALFNLSLLIFFWLGII